MVFLKLMGCILELMGFQKAIAASWTSRPVNSDLVPRLKWGNWVHVTTPSFQVASSIGFQVHYISHYLTCSHV